MRLLVTGALGHIGSRFMRSLRPGDWESVLLLDDLSTQRYGSLPLFCHRGAGNHCFAFTVQLNEYAAVVVVLMGVLGGLLAKELRLFGTEPEKMDRQYRYEYKQKSLFGEDPFTGP